MAGRYSAAFTGQWVLSSALISKNFCLLVFSIVPNVFLSLRLAFWLALCGGWWVLVVHISSTHCSFNIGSFITVDCNPLIYPTKSNSPGHRAYWCAELAICFLVVAVTIASAHYPYPRRDDQAELARVAVCITVNVLGHIIEVTLHRAGLVLRWMTIHGYTILGI